MFNKNVFLSFFATVILMFSLSAPLFLDVVVLEVFSKGMPLVLGLVAKLLNILLLAYCIPSIVKTAKGIYLLFIGLKLK